MLADERRGDVRVDVVDGQVAGCAVLDVLSDVGTEEELAVAPGDVDLAMSLDYM